MAEKMRDGEACLQCQTRMEVLKIKKYPGPWPAVLIVAGVFCSLFFIGALVGVPMLLLGIYMVTSKETISHCPGCGHYFRVWMEGEGSG